MGKSKHDYFDAFVSIFMFLGLLVIAIGIYLIINKKVAVGLSTEGRGAPRAGTLGVIRGEFVLAIGIFFTAFPTYALLEKFFRKLFRKKT